MSGPQSNNYIPGYQQSAGTMNLNGYPMANGMQPGYTGGMGFSFKKRGERIDWRKLGTHNRCLICYIIPNNSTLNLNLNILINAAWQILNLLYMLQCHTLMSGLRMAS